MNRQGTSIASTANSAPPGRPVLILTPDLRGNVGGVANYYNVVRLHELLPVEYLFVNSAQPEAPLRRALRLVANYARFLHRITMRRYALIHFNPSLNAKSFFRDGVFVLLARLSCAPRLIFFRGWEDEYAEQILRRPALRTFFRVTFGASASYVVLGRRFDAKLRELGVRDGRIFIETTVADGRPPAPGPHRAARAFPSDHAVALFMSRLVDAKGVRIAIDAVRYYRAIRRPGQPSMELRIAGSGPDEAAIRAYAAQAGRDFVTFLGHVTGEAKWRAFEEADLFVFPTCYPEGLPNVVLEALLHGLPVVARPEGALGEVLIDGEHGIVTDSRDPRALAKRLTALLADPERFLHIGQRNRAEAERRFTRESVARRILDIYSTVAGTGGAGTR